jgi:hypothetical protein
MPLDKGNWPEVLAGDRYSEKVPREGMSLAVAYIDCAEFILQSISAKKFVVGNIRLIWIRFSVSLHGNDALATSASTLLESGKATQMGRITVKAGRRYIVIHIGEDPFVSGTT